MNNINITGIINAHNNQRWIASCLREASKLCDQIVVLDVGSTDDTPKICSSFAGVKYRYFKRAEDRDKRYPKLLAWLKKKRTEWVLFLDGDEVLEEGAANTIRREISRLDPRDPIFYTLHLRSLYFWNDTELFRCDNSDYGNVWRPKLLAVCGQDSESIFDRDMENKKGRKIDVCVKNYRYLSKTGRKGIVERSSSEIPLAKWVNRNQRENISAKTFMSHKHHYLLKPEIIKMLPIQAKKILHVGCGDGSLGAAIKEQDSQKEVVGIGQDINATVAESRLDYVVLGKIENMKLDFEVGYFDCIIVTGVLEYLENPFDMLLYLKKYLHLNGCLILTIPNVRNLNTLKKLVEDGRWSSQSGDLRFFAIKNVKNMLKKINMDIELTKQIYDPTVSVSESSIETHKMILKNISKQEIEELQTAIYVTKSKILK